ncbi:hypothetical protein Cs7R123_12850 [Catellatospora sp. TT07R-123]|uniref:VOC family protein n=1 Tax=Catellatospora sp. TT07R-123 TaxID=2733863 RepID=UPI001B14AA09|nr:VOC family protein [Catellatospora sp. TT07R-123]GHJ43943.1 hypothetical protein Cs7R123_12850 [Catellatospora sp. TT07R-123]
MVQVTGAPIRPRQFHEADGTGDWRVTGEGACACYRTGSLAEALRLATAIGALDLGGLVPDLDLRGGELTVRLITVTDDYYGLTDADLAAARLIAELARELGAVADPTAPQTVQVTIDALVGPQVVPFWRALLGYADRAGSPEDLIDPRRRGAPFYFQQMDTPRPQRNRVHVDVWVPYDQAESRLAAALAAGGHLLTAEHAPSHWVLADPEGNEACLATAGCPS